MAGSMRRRMRSKRSSKNTKRRRRSSKRQRGGVAGKNMDFFAIALPQDARRSPYSSTRSHSVKPHQTPSSLAMAAADGTRKRRSTRRQRGGLKQHAMYSKGQNEAIDLLQHQHVPPTLNRYSAKEATTDLRKVSK